MAMLLLLRAVTVTDVALVVEFAARPKQTARDEVEITGVFHGGVVVTDRGAEHTGAVVVIDPGDDVVILLRRTVPLLHRLPAVGKRRGRREYLNVVVKLLVDRRPVVETVGDRMGLVCEADRDWQLRPVGAGLDAEVIKPERPLGTGGGPFAGVADAVAVHGAMQVHAGNAHAVRREDALDDRGIVDVGGALVVDHDIVALRVIGVAVDRERRFGRGVVVVDLINDHIGASFEAVLEDVLLSGVVVAAAACDQQDSQR